MNDSQELKYQFISSAKENRDLQRDSQVTMQNIESYKQRRRSRAATTSEHYYQMAGVCLIISLICGVQAAFGQQQQQQQKQQAAMNAEQLGQMSAAEQQHFAALSQLPVGSIAVAAHQQQQQQQQQQMPTIPDAQQLGPASGRARLPRSIGDVFKRFFGASKRSKSSTGSGPSSSMAAGAGASPQGAISGSPMQVAMNREWEFQQQNLQQQQQQQQQLQQQSLAAGLLSQPTVYAASPFATSGALYTPTPLQYPAAGTSGLLTAWPTSQMGSGSAGSLRPVGSATPLYAAASQSYSSYAAPPPALAAAAAASQPMAAASHAHPSVAAPPSTPIDFHQVLDAFVRTSGFTPLGDQEAAASGAGYSSKSDASPVFSFKKLVSFPFYLSTEEKPLDVLPAANGHAHARDGAQTSGYAALHSLPLMRRHVRRMSAPASPSQQQQVQQYQQQQRQYSSYLEALDRQFEPMVFSSQHQLAQYMSQQPEMSFAPEQPAQSAPSIYLTSASSPSSPSSTKQQVAPEYQQQQQQQQQELQQLLAASPEISQLPAGMMSASYGASETPLYGQQAAASDMTDQASSYAALGQQLASLALAASQRQPESSVAASQSIAAYETSPQQVQRPTSRQTTNISSSSSSQQQQQQQQLQQQQQQLHQPFQSQSSLINSQAEVSHSQHQGAGQANGPPQQQQQQQQPQQTMMK